MNGSPKVVCPPCLAVWAHTNGDTLIEACTGQTAGAGGYKPLLAPAVQHSHQHCSAGLLMLMPRPSSLLLPEQQDCSCMSTLGPVHCSLSQQPADPLSNVVQTGVTADPSGHGLC